MCPQLEHNKELCERSELYLLCVMHLKFIITSSGVREGIGLEACFYSFKTSSNLSFLNPKVPFHRAGLLMSFLPHGDNLFSFYFILQRSCEFQTSCYAWIYEALLISVEYLIVHLEYILFLNVTCPVLLFILYWNRLLVCP